MAERSGLKGDPGICRNLPSYLETMICEHASSERRGKEVRDPAAADLPDHWGRAARLIVTRATSSRFDRQTMHLQKR